MYYKEKEVYDVERVKYFVEWDRYKVVEEKYDDKVYKMRKKKDDVEILGVVGLVGVGVGVVVGIGVFIVVVLVVFVVGSVVGIVGVVMVMGGIFGRCNVEGEICFYEY